MKYHNIHEPQFVYILSYILLDQTKFTIEFGVISDTPIHMVHFACAHKHFPPKTKTFILRHLAHFDYRRKFNPLKLSCVVQSMLKFSPQHSESISYCRHRFNHIKITTWNECVPNIRLQFFCFYIL